MNNRSKKENKKSLIAAIMLFVFMLSMGSAVYASSYSTTVKFKNPYIGVQREYDGDNIRYTATMKSSKANDKGKYTVILQRISGMWAIDVGSSDCNRVGKSDVKWSSVGPGEYRLYFYKTQDGVTLSSDNVKIANYK